ncbi:MAG: MOSC N-terminal beta barrel domain-containing protein [Bacteroidota bacterium]
MYRISELYVYPIKSMGGISLKSARLTDTGFAFDRYWMLVDSNRKCLTQREFPVMALFQVQFIAEGIKVIFNDTAVAIPNTTTTTSTMECRIWEDTVWAVEVSGEVSKWFSKHLGQQVRLVCMAPNSVRYVKRHAPSKVHFPDSSPYLVVGEAALGYLNEKNNSPIPMDRFRPNIVFQGGAPHEEDTWQTIQIGNCNFENTKACARCTVITIDQKTGKQGEEPLLGLSKYRLQDRKILFGQYFKVVQNFGEWIRVGDTLDVLKRKTPLSP